MSKNRYEPELKKKVLHLYLEDVPTKKSFTEEFNLVKDTITYWFQQYHKEFEKNPIK